MKEIQENVKNRILEHASDVNLTKNFKETLENEVLSDKLYSFQSKYLENLNDDKLGREFSKNVTKSEISKLISKIKTDHTVKNQHNEEL